ncbi:putative prophage exported protein [Escherichia coli 5-366-08_S4_C1]|nr:putative prophage exported protein [Escherichia coli 5-366-08_S4_C1]
MVGSLGCVMWQDDDRTEIPWNSWPGYILGKKLPTSYEVNAISFDQYNSVATVYFSY